MRSTGQPGSLPTSSRQLPSWPCCRLAGHQLPRRRLAVDRGHVVCTAGREPGVDRGNAQRNVHHGPG